MLILGMDLPLLFHSHSCGILAQLPHVTASRALNIRQARPLATRNRSGVP